MTPKCHKYYGPSFHFVLNDTELLSAIFDKAMTERLKRECLTKKEQATPEKVDLVILSKEDNPKNVEHGVIVYNNNVLEATKELESMEVIDDFDLTETPNNLVEPATGAPAIVTPDAQVISHVDDPNGIDFEFDDSNSDDDPEQIILASDDLIPNIDIQNDDNACHLLKWTLILSIFKICLSKVVFLLLERAE